MFYPKIKYANKVSRYQFPTSKVVCVGRNYKEHAKELNNPIPSEPLLFNKTSNTLVDLISPIEIPSGLGSCHHELELAILIGERLDSSSDINFSGISGIGLALDLTLRELQAHLKSKGHPWERAKSFDGACPISEFIGLEQISDVNNVSFSMTKNGQLAQRGNSGQMIFGFKSLLQSITACFTLYPGDIVLTGTPAGVAELKSGDKLILDIENKLAVETSVY